MTYRASWNNVVVAESDDVVEVEGNAYFPAESIKSEYFSKTETNSVCPWKGTASYYTLNVEGASNPDAAWYYPQPKDAATNIRDHVAFWRGVTVEQV